jgi:hypothetical protein
MAGAATFAAVFRGAAVDFTGAAAVFRGTAAVLRGAAADFRGTAAVFLGAPTAALRAVPVPTGAFRAGAFRAGAEAWRGARPAPDPLP